MVQEQIRNLWSRRSEQPENVEFYRNVDTSAYDRAGVLGCICICAQKEELYRERVSSSAAFATTIETCVYVFIENGP